MDQISLFGCFYCNDNGYCCITGQPCFDVYPYVPLQEVDLYV